MWFWYWDENQGDTMKVHFYSSMNFFFSFNFASAKKERRKLNIILKYKIQLGKYKQIVDVYVAYSYSSHCPIVKSKPNAKKESLLNLAMRCFWCGKMDLGGLYFFNANFLFFFFFSCSGKRTKFDIGKTCEMRLK